MNFSKLRHRIIFLLPTDMIKNSMGETVPVNKCRTLFIDCLMRTETRCFDELFKAKAQNNISPSYGHD